jgi:hypothetical protein
MAKFKVRRDLLAMKASTFTGGVTASSTFDATLGVTAASTLAVTGGIAAASTLAVTGATTIGTDKTKLAKVLAGSLTLTCPSLAASASDTVAGCIPGMATEGSAYKIMAQQVSGGACIVFVGVAASSDSDEGVCTFTFFNATDSAEAATAATVMSYVAVLDSA